MPSDMRGLHVVEYKDGGIWAICGDPGDAESIKDNSSPGHVVKSCVPRVCRVKNNRLTLVIDFGRPVECNASFVVRESTPEEIAAKAPAPGATEQPAE